MFFKNNCLSEKNNYEFNKKINKMYVYFDITIHNFKNTIAKLNNLQFNYSKRTNYKFKKKSYTFSSEN